MHRTIPPFIWLPLTLLFVLAACSAQPQWDKPGVSQQVKQDDMEVCRRAAAERGLVDYPSQVNAPPGWGDPEAWAVMDTYSDDYRYHADIGLTAACMRYKGYQQVPAAK